MYFFLCFIGMKERFLDEEEIVEHVVVSMHWSLAL